MACCGKNRIRFHNDTRTGVEAGGQPPVRPATSLTLMRFEYVGETGLSVRGPITGRTYRFGASGARIAVDSRDAPSLMAVPKLRTVRD
jgi:hypothetical protein